ncbi:MAG: tandem-95 repeat protein [Lysobacteraceae bacterium]
MPWTTARARAEDTAVLVGNVLANDTFEGVGVAVTAADASSANGGTVVNNGDGTFTYTPALDFTGSDTFTYTASSSTGVAETATVTITVSATDDPAVITGDSSGSGAEDGGAITGDLDATDADGLTDGTYFTTTSGTNGSASIDPATGAWSYTPNADWHGSDSFTVTVTDDLGGTTTQGVAITVTAVADAVDDSASTSEDTAVLVGNVLANDTFEGVGVAVTAADASSANGGTVVNNGDGTFTYTPALDFTGSDTFTYTASSSTGVARRRR